MKKSKKIKRKKKISIDTLIDLIKVKCSTQEYVDGFAERVKAREKIFEEESRRMRPTKEFMDRQYTI